MLGFNAISEVSIAELPGAFVPVSGQVVTSAIGELGNETVWGLIIPDVGNTYTNITTGASQTWTEINTGASQTWTDVIQ